MASDVEEMIQKHCISITVHKHKIHIQNHVIKMSAWTWRGNFFEMDIPDEHAYWKMSGMCLGCPLQIEKMWGSVCTYIPFLVFVDDVYCDWDI